MASRAVKDERMLHLTIISNIPTSDSEKRKSQLDPNGGVSTL